MRRLIKQQFVHQLTKNTINKIFNEFARGKCHVNGIEFFWSYCKRRLAKFNGLTDDNFVINLKECEFRFNNRKLNLYAILLKMLREFPL
jgi:transposase-like protein